MIVKVVILVQQERVLTISTSFEYFPLEYHLLLIIAIVHYTSYTLQLCQHIQYIKQQRKTPKLFLLYWWHLECMINSSLLLEPLMKRQVVIVRS